VKNPLFLQIRERMSRYLRGDESVRAFRDWFAPVSWNIEDCLDQETIDLAYRVEGILAESSSARWPESQLKQELAEV
jgi:hypothetical protein